jgi:isoleucyl-tRNA synthetase
MQVREQVNRELEAARNAGLIGSGLAADVELHCNKDLYDMLQPVGDELRFIFITSAASLHLVADSKELVVKVNASPYEKCQRCWHRRADIGANSTHPELCARCVENVAGQGEQRRYA